MVNSCPRNIEIFFSSNSLSLNKFTFFHSQLTDWITSYTLSLIYSISNPTTLHSFNMTKIPENTLLNPFIYPLPYSIQLSNPYIKHSSSSPYIIIIIREYLTANLLTYNNPSLKP